MNLQAESESIGALSPAELHFADEANARADEESARVSALTIHGKAVDRAREARARLQGTLADFLARRAKYVDLHAAIDAHTRAQCWLREAAQAVCDICDFDDNGRAAGVTWETPLTAPEPKDTPEQAGARMADDHFCPSCGARGYRFTCPRCARCE